MIVGITGHQNIGTREQVEWVRMAFDDLLVRHGAQRGLSSLAVGADQLFAEAIIAGGHSFEAVIPCADYENTFHADSARARFRELLSCAARIHELSFASPSEEAFLAAGRWIVAHCDLLFAVWNGLPARGLGGTADIVAAARLHARPWIHIDPVRQEITTHLKKEN